MNSSAPTFRSSFILVLAVLSAAGATSCGEGGGGGGSPVEPNNRAPVAAGAIPSQTMIAGESATVNVSSYFNDPDGDALAYAAATSNAAVASVSVSGSTLTIAAVAPGTATVTVTARDPGGLEAAQRTSVAVQQGNQAPVAVGTIPPLTLTEGKTATVNVSSYFNDPDGDALAYAAATSNAAVASVSVSGSTLTIAAVAPGTATVTVTARDPGGLTVTQSMSVTVQANQAPVVVATIPPLTLTEGKTATVNVSSYFNDPDGDALAYAAATSNAAVASVSVSGSTLTIAAVAPGTATVTVTARDPGGLEAAQRTSVAVQQGNQAPVAVGTIPPLTLTEGKTATVNVSSYFNDPDGDALAYAAATSNAAVASVSVSGSTLTIAAVAPGTATVTVTARDPGGLTVTQSMSVTVQANQAPVVVATIPPLTLTEGKTATVNVSSYFNERDGPAGQPGARGGRYNPALDLDRRQDCQSESRPLLPRPGQGPDGLLGGIVQHQCGLGILPLVAQLDDGNRADCGNRHRDGDGARSGRPHGYAEHERDGPSQPSPRGSGHDPGPEYDRRREGDVERVPVL